MTSLTNSTILKQFTIHGIPAVFPQGQYIDCETAIPELMFLCDTKTRLVWTYTPRKLPF